VPGSGFIEQRTKKNEERAKKKEKRGMRNEE
jgi:hypothetical protein